MLLLFVLVRRLQTDLQTCWPRATFIEGFAPFAQQCRNTAFLNPAPMTEHHSKSHTNPHNFRLRCPLPEQPLLLAWHQQAFSCPGQSSLSSGGLPTLQT